jgi:hypothetical protein
MFIKCIKIQFVKSSLSQKILSKMLLNTNKSKLLLEIIIYAR